MEKRPVVAVTIVFALSIALAPFVPLSIPSAILLLVLALLPSAGLNSGSRSFRWTIVLSIFSLLGILIVKLDEANPLFSSLDSFLDREVAVEAQVISCLERERAMELVLQPLSLTCDGAGRNLRKAPRLLLRCYTDGPEGGDSGSRRCKFHYGDVVRVAGSLEQIHSPQNPGAPDFTEIRRREGIGYMLRPYRGEIPAFTGRVSGSPLIRAVLMLRERMLEVLRSNHSSGSAELLTGIVFGGSAGLDEQIAGDFRTTGTYHILSASGMNVAILIVAIAGLFRALNRSTDRAALMMLPVVALYAVMAGGTPSVTRAAIMAAIAVSAALIGRKHDLLNTFFVTVFTMLASCPDCIHDPGFQMSAAGVLGIIVIMPVMKPLIDRLPCRLRPCGEVMAVSVAVQAAIAPILAWHFNQLSLLAPLCNIVIVPPAGALLYCGLLEGMAGLFLPMLGAVVAIFSEVVLSLMIRAVHFMAGLPLCSIGIPRPSMWSCIIYYTVLGFVFAGKERLISRAAAVHMEKLKSLVSGRSAVDSKTFSLACFLSVLAAFAVMAVLFLSAHRELRAVFMDVGQGDSLWISMPGGQQVVLDGGPSYRRRGEERASSDAGKKIVAPVLRAGGVGRLDLLLLSHCHEDHYGGVDSIVRTVRVDCFGACQDTLSELQCRGGMKVLTDEGVKVVPLSTGKVIEFSGGGCLRVMSSGEVRAATIDPAGCVSRSGDSAGTGSMGSNSAGRDSAGVDLKGGNENCLVVQLVHHNVRMLFMADCDAGGEWRLLESIEGLRSDLLKVGHHGSATSTSEPFLDAVSPRYAVISCGWKNRMGHPSPEVVERLEGRGIDVLRTDLDGAVIATSDGRSLKVGAMRKHPGHSSFR